MSILDYSPVRAAGPISTLWCPLAGRSKRRDNMGKYVLGWFLGVPVVVLVIAYMIFN